MKLSRLCLSLLLALIGFAAWAEPPNDDQWLEHMKRRLNLTEQQVGELKKIHEELKPEREALREQHKALHAKMAERLKKVLTEEQQKKFDEMRERQAGRGMHGMRGMHGDGAGMGQGAEPCGAEMADCPKQDDAAAKPGKPAKPARPGKAPAAAVDSKGGEAEKP